MAYTTLEPIIAKHPFFEEMDSQYLAKQPNTFF
jgi:hypothetical protein